MRIALLLYYYELYYYDEELFENIFFCSHVPTIVRLFLEGVSRTIAIEFFFAGSDSARFGNISRQNYFPCRYSLIEEYPFMNDKTFTFFLSKKFGNFISFWSLQIWKFMNLKILNIWIF